MKRLNLNIKSFLVKIADLENILAQESRVFSIIKTECLELKEKYNDDRRTDLGESIQSVELEDLIPEQTVAILKTRRGIVKRMPIASFP